MIFSLRKILTIPLPLKYNEKENTTGGFFMRKIKQIVLTLLAFSTTLLLSVGFTGCELPDFNKLLGRGSSQVGTSENGSSSSSEHEHSYIETVIQEASCTAEGIVKYECTCGHSYTDSIAIVPHEEISHEAKASTCTEQGWDAYVTCANCSYSTQVKLPLATHEEISHEAKASTCIEQGWDAYVACANCSYSTQVKLPLSGHAFEDGACSVCSEPDPDYAFSVGLAYEFGEDGTYSVTGIGTCTDTVIKIPSTYKGSVVKRIGERAFYNVKITGVQLPTSVTFIDDYAFAHTNLKEVFLHEGVEGIGRYAFYYCSLLTKINIPETITAINIYAFSHCISLVDFTWHDGITHIYEGTFECCRELNITLWPSNLQAISAKAFTACWSLTRITLPASLYSGGRIKIYGEGEEAPFYQCYKLTEVYNQMSKSFGAGKTDYGYVGYYAANVALSASSLGEFSVDENGYELYTAPYQKVVIGYQGTDTKLTLPEGTTRVQCGAFYRENKANQTITSITMPDTVKVIGDYAFTDCLALTTVKLSANLTSIKRIAFNGCNLLTSITLPSTITEIGENAFRNCTSLKTVNVKNGAKLNIIKGSPSNGYVAYYATAVNYIA